MTIEQMTGAVIIGKYRYKLWRHWDEKKKAVCFLMLNPSTADVTRDDMTIRKCIGFAKEFGYGGIVVVNLYAIRATDPHYIAECGEPTGPENDEYIKWAAKEHVVIGAWGNYHMQGFKERVAAVRSIVGEMFCLGKTLSGNPRHPSRLAYSTQLETL